MSNQYFNTEGASKHYKLSQSYLAKLRHFGGGPEYIKAGKRILYSQQKFDSWLNKKERSSTSDVDLNVT